MSSKINKDTVSKCKDIAYKCMSANAKISDSYKKNHPISSFDLRDFTDENLVYGMQVSRIKIRNTDDGDLNFGGLLSTIDKPHIEYRFFTFKNLYREIVNIFKRCDCKNDFKVDEIPFEYIVSPIISVLGTNRMFYKKVIGNKDALLIRIFLYGGGLECGETLESLAKKFMIRDEEEAKGMYEYESSRWNDAYGRVFK